MNRRLTLLVVLITIAGSAALSGCAARVESLKDISLNTRYNVSGQNQMDVPILIKPMVEDRNRDFSVVVPAVPFWYSALNNYPDSSAAFGGRLGVLIGDLPTAFPFMLARELREARLSPNVVVFQELNYESSPSDFPIHIEGSIKECSIYAGVNPIPAGIVAILGVPMGGAQAISLGLRQRPTLFALELVGHGEAAGVVMREQHVVHRGAMLPFGKFAPRADEGIDGRFAPLLVARRVGHETFHQLVTGAPLVGLPFPRVEERTLVGAIDLATAVLATAG